MRWRLAALALAVASLQPAASGVAASDDHGMNDPRGCPGHYCRNYRIDCVTLKDVSCGPVSSEPVRIDYWINPTNIWGVSPQEIAKWVRYAGRTWELTNPRLRFRFLGFTSEHAVPNDGMNVIAFQELEAAGRQVDSQAGLEQWDIWLNSWHEPVAPMSIRLRASKH
jgi:hypothetical protein